MRWFKFRHFSTRLLFLLVGLLVLVQGAVYLIVSRANEHRAQAHISENLAVGARVYREAIEQRREDMARSARLMSSDYAIRQLLLREPRDEATLSSVLLSYTTRVGAPVIVLFDPEGRLIASAHENLTSGHCGPFRDLIERAEYSEPQQASDFAYLNGGFHILVTVPLYAPYPETVAWFGLAYPIDDHFAQKIGDTTLLDVTFTSGPGGPRDRVLATTLSPANATQLATFARTDPGNPGEVVTLSGEPYVTEFQTLKLLGAAPARIALQRSLNAELAPARALQNLMLLVSLAALALGTLTALWFARGLSQPVRQLAAQTKRVAAGDYRARFDLPRVDELGQLANAFNEMTAGLAERDRVRDLLDKNVSPEIAAQLMRDGAALGGEEREVTILFVDLQGFTTLSEKLPPREMIALLNRYLDRMSTEIERHGGVIDKFIGDAIMAIFGAPVSQADAADRALQSALAMKTALGELNHQLASEGIAALAIGIGINTARVVAGNIGSQRRLNYSVIGDGVNVAARIEALTRNPEYRTDILVSAATLSSARQTYTVRDLGAVTVKGRHEPVSLSALDS